MGRTAVSRVTGASESGIGAGNNTCDAERVVEEVIAA